MIVQNATNNVACICSSEDRISCRQSAPYVHTGRAGARFSFALTLDTLPLRANGEKGGYRAGAGRVNNRHVPDDGNKDERVDGHVRRHVDEVVHQATRDVAERPPASVKHIHIETEFCGFSTYLTCDVAYYYLLMSVRVLVSFSDNSE